MSNTHKRPSPKQPQRQSKPLVLFVGAALLVVVIVAALLLSSAEPFVPEVTGAPHLSVAQTHYDYGNVRNNTWVETVVRVRNTGDQPLIFTSEPHVQVVEGCCPPRATFSDGALRPGEEATVTLRFSMHEGMDGPHDFRLHLYTNDPDEPEKTITILSNWVA
jgi:archaellum component FlaG (FlaF/FlaG flagellin family)